MRQITSDTTHRRSPSFDENDEFTRTPSFDHSMAPSRPTAPQNIAGTSSNTSGAQSSSHGAAGSSGHNSRVPKTETDGRVDNLNSRTQYPQAPARPMHPQGTPPRSRPKPRLDDSSKNSSPSGSTRNGGGVPAGPAPRLGASWEFQGNYNTGNAADPSTGSAASNPRTHRRGYEHPEEKTRGGARDRTPSTPRIGFGITQERTEARIRRNRAEGSPNVGGRASPNSTRSPTSPSSAAPRTPTSMADIIRNSAATAPVPSSSSLAMSPPSGSTAPVFRVVPPPQSPAIAAGTAIVAESSSVGNRGGVPASSGAPETGRNPASSGSKPIDVVVDGAVREDKNINSAQRSPKQYPPVPVMPGPRPKAGPGSRLSAAGASPAAMVPMKKVALGEGRTQIGFIKMMEGNKKPEQRRVPRSEVALHSKRSDCWVIFNNKVYDVTSYLPYHPGGKSVLAQYGGKDGTEAFYEAHRWISIEGLLSKCCLGTVCDG